MGQTDIYSVTRLNGEIKAMLEGNPAFRNVFVRGEVSNFKLHSSGHCYFTLKDEAAAISAVLFRSDAMRLRFHPENGMKVIARGRISSFPKSGQVQLYAADLMPEGAGALHLAFEQLKRKLYDEGLFDEAHKKPIPRLPESVAIITSPTGAALHDMLRILGRRFPVAAVEVYPSLVQGPDAPADLCRALQLANAQGTADVMIIGRGGGSLEDLWAFNDERVARAIAASAIPVISAVGHEPDITIADFVADARAATPSHAAEIAAPDREALYDFFRRADAALSRALGGALEAKRQQFDLLCQRLQLRTPKRYIDEKRLLLEYETQRMTGAMDARAQGERARFTRAVAYLDALSPLKVLSRGYAIATDAMGEAITDSSFLQTGDLIDLRLHRGAARCEVFEITKPKRKKA